MSSSFKTLGGVIATLGIANFIKDNNTAYTVQMQNEVKLQTIMRQRMGSTAQEIEQIKTLASEQQKLGIIGDEVQLAGLQQLATFASQESTLQTLLPAMNNLIAQQDGYAASTSGAINIGNLMGKVLQGQTSALTRVGITFTEAQEKVLKYGNEQERAAMLAEVITDNVGEMNEALRGTSTGALTALNNDLGDMKELIGESFQPLISSFVPVLSDLLQELQPIISGVATGIEVVANAFDSLSEPTQKAVMSIGAVTLAVKLLTKTVGGAAAWIMLLGTALAYIVGEYGKTEEEIAETAETALMDAGGAASIAAEETAGLNDELKKTASQLAGFDEITKLSGGSSSLASTIATKDDIKNINDATDALEEFRKAENALDGATIGFELPEFDPLAFEIDTERLYADIKRWIETTDWNGTFLDVGNALESVIATTLTVVDGLFGTHLADWYEKTQQYWYDWGEKLYAVSNPSDEGVAAYNDYEKTHGETPWAAFYRKYQEGANPYEAFSEIYNTPNLQKGFLTVDARTAGRYIKEWEGLSDTEIAELITSGQKKKVDDLVALSYQTGDNSLFGLEGNIARLMYDAKVLTDDSWYGKWEKTGFRPEYLFGIEKPTLDNPEIPTVSASEAWNNQKALSDSMVNSDNLYNPLTALEIVEAFRYAPIEEPLPNLPPINLNFSLDGDPIKEWSKSWSSEETSITNGRNQ